MRRIQILIIVSLFIAGFVPLYLSAQEEQIPEWIKRIDFGVDVGTDQKPYVYLETVQPLYQNKERSRILFVQPQIMTHNGKSIYNLGMGYRKLLFNESVLGGINIFYDYQDEYSHSRWGLGLEALGEKLEARANTYFGISGRRTIKETSTHYTYEKVVDGLDFEIGGPLPHFPSIKVYGSGFYYNYEKFKDKEGWKLRTELTLNQNSKINLIIWDDNKGDTEFRTDAYFSIKFDTLSDFFTPFKTSSQTYPRRDLRKYMLSRVERNYQIEVEKWTESKVGGVIVEIKRGN